MCTDINVHATVMSKNMLLRSWWTGGVCSKLALIGYLPFARTLHVLDNDYDHEILLIFSALVTCNKGFEGGKLTLA